MKQTQKIKTRLIGKKPPSTISKKDKILFATAFIFLLSLLGWFSITVVIPQKQRLHREQNMSMWNSKGRQLLSRIGYCDEFSSSQTKTDITSYTTSTKKSNQSENSKTVAKKSCEKAQLQLLDAQQWCSIDIPLQLQIEGEEIQNKRYLEQKEFVLVILTSMLIIYVQLMLSDLVEALKIGVFFFFNVALLVNQDLLHKKKKA